MRLNIMLHKLNSTKIIYNVHCILLDPIVGRNEWKRGGKLKKHYGIRILGCWYKLLIGEGIKNEITHWKCKWGGINILKLLSNLKK